MFEIKLSDRTLELGSGKNISQTSNYASGETMIPEPEANKVSRQVGTSMHKDHDSAALLANYMTKECGVKPTQDSKKDESKS